MTSAGLESRAARATFEEVVVEVSYFAFRHGGGLRDLAVRGGMVVIRRPFRRFFSQCIEAAGAGRGVLLFVVALPVEGPIRLSAVEGIYVAVVARLLAPFPATDEG